MKEYIVLAVNEMAVKQFDELGAPELVRCKDYTHYWNGYCDHGKEFRPQLADFYCADGERRTE